MADLSPEIDAIATELATGSMHTPRNLMAMYPHSYGERREAFVAALIGELVAARTQLRTELRVEGLR